MKYVDKTLTGDEKIIYNANVDWFTFVLPLIMLLIGLYIYTNLVPLDSASGDKLVIAVITHVLFIIFILKGILSLMSAIFYKISTELVITTKRIIFKTGFIKRKTVELNYKQIESLSFNQSILGRIFNFGDISIYGTGGVVTPIYDIDNPLVFRNKATELIDTV